MGEVPLGAYERPQFQAFPHRVRAQIVWPSTSRCQSRPNAGKAAHDRVPPAQARIQGSAVQTARARLSLLPSVCYSGPLRAGSTEGVAFLGIAVGRPKHSVLPHGALTPVVCVCDCGGTVHVARGGPLSYGSRGERSAAHPGFLGILFSHLSYTVVRYGTALTKI